MLHILAILFLVILFFPLAVHGAVSVGRMLLALGKCLVVVYLWVIGAIFAVLLPSVFAIHLLAQVGLPEGGWHVVAFFIVTSIFLGLL